MNLAGGMERQIASDLAHNPEAKGRGLAEDNQSAEEGASDKITSDLRRGVFRTEDAGLFLRSS